MRVGVYLPQVGFAWDDLLARVRLMDDEGIESVWFMDHLYPPGMPDVPAFEAWTTATAVAAATTRIRIGHLVLAAGMRHPALLAKMAVTLDHVSHGRLELGLGSGSVREEFERIGLPFGSPAERAARLGETLAVLRRLLGDEHGPCDGDTGRLADLPSHPPPLQSPRPPIHVGGAGQRHTLPLVAEHADVWNCPTYALGVLPQRLDALRQACDRVGRDPASLAVTEEAVLALAPNRAGVGAARALAERRFGGAGWGLAQGGYVGTPDDVLRRIEERRRLGVDGVVFFLHDRAQPATIRLLARQIVAPLRAMDAAPRLG